MLSVNPYKQLNIYGQDVVAQYKNREIHERPPHIFALADAAYKTMRRLNKDTCIVISGECAAAFPPFSGRWPALENSSS